MGGCSACGGPPSELVVEGPPGFVRCLAYEVDERDPWSEGDLRLRLEGRTLEVEAPEEVLRVAALAGPGPGPAGLGTLASELTDSPVELLFILGGLGDSVLIAQQTLESLAELGVLTLVMAGGRDDVEVWEEAWGSVETEALGRVLDARGLNRLRFQGAELILISGAPGGRYARTDTSCGFATEDVEAMVDTLGPASGPRAFVSWVAPGGVGHAWGGLDVGSPALAALAEEAGIRGGIFAWPRALRGEETSAATAGEQAPTGLGRHRFVERLGGLPMLRDEGRLARGRLARFRFGSDGLEPVISAP